jgi:hypothetical protein
VAVQAVSARPASAGDLGNNSAVGSSGVPVPVYTVGVLAGVTLTQITSGNQYSCAPSSTGAAYTATITHSAA